MDLGSLLHRAPQLLRLVHRQPLLRLAHRLLLGQQPPPLHPLLTRIAIGATATNSPITTTVMPTNRSAKETAMDLGSLLHRVRQLPLLHQQVLNPVALSSGVK